MTRRVLIRLRRFSGTECVRDLSQVFHNQTIVFTLLHSRNTYAIGASGTFCLPYLRKLHAGDIDIPIETLIGIPIPNDGELFKWSGSVYVEYEGQDLLTPNRLE